MYSCIFTVNCDCVEVSAILAIIYILFEGLDKFMKDMIVNSDSQDQKQQETMVILILHINIVTELYWLEKVQMLHQQSNLCTTSIYRLRAQWPCEKKHVDIVKFFMYANITW